MTDSTSTGKMALETPKQTGGNLLKTSKQQSRSQAARTPRYIAKKPRIQEKWTNRQQTVLAAFKMLITRRRDVNQKKERKKEDNE